MNNPDWRAYERFILRQQLEAGCDGVFFDNPTVHPQGCYCDWCMQKFAAFARKEGLPGGTDLPAAINEIALWRVVAATNVAAFMRFRCTIARDFLNEMRDFARSIKPGALVTANNSLNSAEALFSQCRSYGYNIYEMSQAEDF